MSNSSNPYIRKLTTPDGAIVSMFHEPGKSPKLHSITGPAIKYPKAACKKDIYAIYGKELTKREWLTLKNDVKVQTPLPEYG